MAAEAYHLVCRDCKFEQIAESADVSYQQAVDHEALTDHRVAFKQIL